MCEYRYDLTTIEGSVGRRDLRGSRANHGRQIQVLEPAMVLAAVARTTRSEIEEAGSSLDVSPTTTVVRIFVDLLFLPSNRLIH